MWPKKQRQRPRDWSKKKYGNPLFHNRGHKKFKANVNWVIRLIVVFVLLCLGCLGWFFFYSSIFIITTLEVAGNERIGTEVLEQAFWNQSNQTRFFIAKQNNIFLFDSGKLADKINSQYILDQLEIKKHLLHKVSIHLKEKPFALIWHEGGEYYWINPDGTIILNSFSLDNMPGNLPIIENRGAWAAGDKVISGQQDRINFILTLAQQIDSVQPKIVPEKYLLAGGEDPTITLVASTTPTIDFTIKEAPEKQLNRLVLLIKTTLKTSFSKKRYINLKYGEKIFYE